MYLRKQLKLSLKKMFYDLKKITFGKKKDRTNTPCIPISKLSLKNCESNHSTGIYVFLQFMFKKSLEGGIYTEIAPNMGISNIITYF